MIYYTNSNYTIAFLYLNDCWYNLTTVPDLYIIHLIFITFIDI